MAVDFPKPVIHGGTGKRQRENTGKNLLDFSASLNPLPPGSRGPAIPAAFHHTLITDTPVSKSVSHRCSTVIRKRSVWGTAPLS